MLPRLGDGVLDVVLHGVQGEVVLHGGAGAGGHRDVDSGSSLHIYTLQTVLYSYLPALYI